RQVQQCCDERDSVIDVTTSLREALIERDTLTPKQAQQKPAVNALEQVVTAANASVSAMRREMSRYTWKSA
ncbi:tRNA modification GTPase, partial [Klebsiella pneumoniae]|nr:tRNA modification GTPase [Klebsiella pneumoniae]